MSYQNSFLVIDTSFLLSRFIALFKQVWPNIYLWYIDLCFEFVHSDSADKVVLHTGKYEELIVCSHEIAASTAQLVAASKVPLLCYCVI